MTYLEFLNQYESIEKHHIFSTKTIESIRTDLNDSLKESAYKDKLTIVTTGSFGRKEASASSDLDMFIFFDSDHSTDNLVNEIDNIKIIIDKYITKQAGDTGTFGPEVVIHFNKMLLNLGGENDSNKAMTRRMLFLLEGAWLFNESGFKKYRAELLAKYIKPDNPQSQISRFLLNDIIRYYRTIATDFEQKTSENNKAWGLRNTKLRFSRKILYFGGIVSVAEVAQLTNEEKIEKLLEMFDKSALERIWEVGMKNETTKSIFDIYQFFLTSIDDDTKRKDLEKVTREDRDKSQNFVEMREKGKEFSTVLENWLRLQYSVDTKDLHPIHNALLF